MVTSVFTPSCFYGPDQRDLRLGNLTVIVGGNSSGKTSLLNKILEKVNINEVPVDRKFKPCSQIVAEFTEQFEFVTDDLILLGESTNGAIRLQNTIETLVNTASLNQTVILDDFDLGMSSYSLWILSKFVKHFVDSGIQIIIGCHTALCVEFFIYSKTDVWIDKLLITSLYDSKRRIEEFTKTEIVDYLRTYDTMSEYLSNYI